MAMFQRDRFEPLSPHLIASPLPAGTRPEGGPPMPDRPWHAGLAGLTTLARTGNPLALFRAEVRDGRSHGPAGGERSDRGAVLSDRRGDTPGATDRPMTVADVMTSLVITVRPDAPVDEIAEVLVRRRISAVPVVGADRRLVGIVSESDLMRRVEIGTVRDRSGWRDLFRDAHVAALDYVRAHGRRARHVMSGDVVTATEHMPLGEAAALLERRRVGRLPVLRGDRLVGIVSRADLVGALAKRGRRPARPERDDRAVGEAVMAQIRALPSGPLVNATVRDGVVGLWGQVSSEAERQAVRVAAENTPGVSAIDDHLHRRPPSAF